MLRPGFNWLARRRRVAITLVEILVATTILAFSIGPIIAMFGFASRNLGSSVHRIQAQFLAHLVLESVKAEVFRFPRAAQNFTWRVEASPVQNSTSSFSRSRINFFNNALGLDKPITKDSELYEQFSQFRVYIDFTGSRTVRTVKVIVVWSLEGKQHTLEMLGNIDSQPYKFIREERY